MGDRLEVVLLSEYFEGHITHFLIKTFLLCNLVRRFSCPNIHSDQSDLSSLADSKLLARLYYLIETRLTSFQQEKNRQLPGVFLVETVFPFVLEITKVPVSAREIMSVCSNIKRRHPFLGCC